MIQRGRGRSRLLTRGRFIRGRYVPFSVEKSLSPLILYQTPTEANTFPPHPGTRQRHLVAHPSPILLLADDQPDLRITLPLATTPADTSLGRLYVAVVGIHAT